MQIQIEPLNIEKKEISETILLPALTDEQKKIINPIVPPTSGIRMVVLKRLADSLIMHAENQYMFVRVFKAISEIAKKEICKKNPGVLLVSDDRPSANHLIGLYAKILAFDEYKIYFQKTYDPVSIKEAQNEPFYSRMGTPHGSASVALYQEIDLVIVLTASHNELIWNGVKFYIDLPMPVSGRVMQAVCKRALELTNIPIKSDFSVQYLDADKVNNDYIIQITEKILDLTPLQNTKILLWPYMGRAPELCDLFKRVGVEVTLIDKQMEPPNPTVNIEYNFLDRKMGEKNIRTAILLDTDRDRIVIITRDKTTGELKTYLPNSLYTAMHNILARDYNKKIINVRTIPSDPRGDNASQLNIVTGVGYKHLGMVLYGALRKAIDPLKFSTGILYSEEKHQYHKINKIEDILTSIDNSNLQGNDILMVLWEESGGHTINLLDIHKEGKNIQISSSLPTIGDKYPAEALLILCTLIAQDYDLTKSITQDIAGTRKMIDANDEKKVKIVNTFSKLEGETFHVGQKEYLIKTFQQVDGKIAIIYLTYENINVYFRPSGTGPGVRVYIFGPKEEIELELDRIIAKINEMF